MYVCVCSEMSQARFLLCKSRGGWMLRNIRWESGAK